MLEQDAIQSLGSLEPRCVDLDEGVFFGKTVLIGPILSSPYSNRLSHFPLFRPFFQPFLPFVGGQLIDCRKDFFRLSLIELTRKNLL